jgi:TonB family protein
MGTVYEARHVTTRKRCALKLLRREFSSNTQIVERFLREARAPAEIGHPGIADVFDADRDPVRDQVFLVMEYLEGEDLRVRLSKTPSLGERLALFAGVLEPLAAAHAKGFVHRDLKPENVFVARERDGSERVKLLDFGIARQMTADRLTQTGLSMGTPHYMSPEQWRSAKASTPQTDVWAFGVMLYEAIAGDVPFGGETAGDITVRVCTEPQVPLVVHQPAIPPAVAALVDRCLAKNPAERPADASSLLAEFRALAAQHPEMFATSKLAGSLGIADYSSGVIRTTAKPIAATAPLGPGITPVSNPTPVGHGTPPPIAMPLPPTNAPNAMVTPNHAGAFATPSPAVPMRTEPFATPTPGPGPYATPHVAPIPPTTSSRSGGRGWLLAVAGLVVFLVVGAIAAAVLAAVWVTAPDAPVAPIASNPVEPPAAPPPDPAPELAQPGPAPPEPAQPEPTPPELTHGHIPPEAILRVIDANRREIARCYDRARRQRPDLAGSVRVRGIIAPDGSVSTAEIESSTLHHPEAEACMLDSVRGWHFNRPEGGSAAIVIPFDFDSHDGAGTDEPSSEPGTGEPAGDPVAACAREGAGDAFNRCVVRTVRPVGERNLRALAGAHRALGDRSNACRTMRLYVDRYGSSAGAAGFRSYLESNCGGASDVDDLLARALPRESTGMSEQTESPRSGLPQTPGRASISRALGQLTGRIRQCAGDRTGTASAAITFRSDGSVSDVSMTGPTFGSAALSCMSAAVRGARVEPFQQATFRVNYPFNVRGAATETPGFAPENPY